MAVLLKWCSRWNVRLSLIATAITVVSVFWYFSTSQQTQIHTNIHEDRIEAERNQLREEINMLYDSEPGEHPHVFDSRIVHLDFKGAPPKLSYLAQIFPLFSKLGATGVLIEYEDMFPYTGHLDGISATNAFSTNDIIKINQLAKENKLEIIPLVQTFGHFEFVLKLKEFYHLREVTDYPLVVCPSHNETLPVLHEMLQQISKLHPFSKRMHIGADEVYSDLIGKCSSCQERMSANFWASSDLFLNHVSSIAHFVKDKLQLQPLMWDDEFRAFSESDLVRAQVGDLVEIVVWNYQPTLQLGGDIWNKYLNVFNAIWVASAFKGATGSNQVVTDIQYHMQNHMAWMSFVDQYKNTVYQSKFKGIMLTGWQRYDHFAVLCELLPVSLPSLTYNLLLLHYGNEQNRINNEATRLLQCRDSVIRMMAFPAGYSSYTNECRFPGSEVFTAVHNFVRVREQYEKLLNDSVVRGWMTDYNIVQQFSSPIHLKRISVELFYLKSSLESVVQECEAAFDLVYDEFTLREWLSTYVSPLQSSVNKLCKAADMLASKKVWPRRPLEV